MLDRQALLFPIYLPDGAKPVLVGATAHSLLFVLWWLWGRRAEMKCQFLKACTMPSDS